MPGSAQHFRAFLDCVRQRCPEAIGELVACYSPGLLKLIRQRLHSRLRSVCDPDDILQDVWCDFLRGDLPNQTFETAQSLNGFLGAMACNRAHAANRHWLDCRKCALRLEVPLPAATGAAAADLEDRGATPFGVALADDLWEHLVGDRPPHHERILALLRDGYSHRETAVLVGRSEKTVQRVLDLARQCLEDRPP